MTSHVPTFPTGAACFYLAALARGCRRDGPCPTGRTPLRGRQGHLNIATAAFVYRAMDCAVPQTKQLLGHSHVQQERCVSVRHPVAGIWTTAVASAVLCVACASAPAPTPIVIYVTQGHPPPPWSQAPRPVTCPRHHRLLCVRRKVRVPRPPHHRRRRARHSSRRRAQPPSRPPSRRPTRTPSPGRRGAASRPSGVRPSTQPTPS